MSLPDELHALAAELHEVAIPYKKEIEQLRAELAAANALLAKATVENEWLASKLFTISKRADTETREFAAGLLKIRKEKFAAEAVAAAEKARDT